MKPLESWEQRYDKICLPFGCSCVICRQNGVGDNVEAGRPFTKTTAILYTKDDVGLARVAAVEWAEVVGLGIYFEGGTDNIFL